MEVAVNGLEALEKLRDTPFDVVLMDVQMPVMDGYEATRRIRQEESKRTLPIIAMTANAIIGDREVCIAAGMDDYISKPIDPQTLYAVLAKWIGPTALPSVQPAAAMVAFQAAGPLPSLPGFDTRSSLNRMGGDVALYLGLLAKFAHNQKDGYRTMTNLLVVEDWSTLERAAHTLKGVAATVGATELSLSAYKLEQGVRARSEKQQLHALLAQVSESLTTALEIIAQALPKPAENREVEEDGITDIAALVPFVQQAEAFLRDFNADAEVAFIEIEQRVKTSKERESLRHIRRLLDSYDYENCLDALQKWAKEAGIINAV